MSVAIKISHAVKKYGNNTVIPDLSLDIREGEFFTLLGPSGCGKTTLLRMIAGFNSIEGGDFYFNEKRINDVEPNKRNIGMVFQNYAIFPHLTVRQNVGFGLKNRKCSKEEMESRTDEYLKLMQIEEYKDRLPERLSGGQQQRVAFARAIAIHPSCILFDEPFSALDAGLREEMRSEVRSLVSQKNITSIFVPHDQLEAMEISDSIIVLDNGRILQQGRPEDIYCSPSRKEVAGFVGHANWLDDSSMVRPENIRIDELHTPGPDYVYMKLPVTSVQFLGEHYEVQVMNGRFPWRIPARQKYTPGTEISLSINRNHIIHF